MTSRLPISTVTRRIFLAHAVFTVAVLGILGPNVFMSVWGVALVVLLDLAVYASLRRPSERTVALMLTAAWFVFFFMLPRLTAFQLFPAITIGFIAVEPFAAHEIEAGLGYIVAGYLAMWAGCSVGGWFFKSPASIAPKPTISIAPLSFYFAVSVGATLFVAYALNVSVYSVDSAQWGNRLGWLSRIFDTDAALVLVITWLALHRRGPMAQKAVAFLSIGVWMALMVILGSRGVPLRLMILIGLAAFVVYGDFKTSFVRVVAIIAVTFVASALTFIPASLIRLGPGSGAAAVANLEEQWFRDGPVRDQLKTIWPTRRAWVTSPVVRRLARMVSPVITRLGLIDYPIVVVTRPADEQVMNAYMRSPHALKNFLNNLVSGEPFPEADIMTSRVFTMAYRGYDETHVRTHFLSEPWTLWGYSWVLGGPLGGLLVIGALAALVQAGYHLLRRAVGPNIAPYAGTAWLFVPALSGLLQLFGMDHWLTITAHFSAAIATGLSIAAVSQLAARRLGRHSLAPR